jgi:hypothetical protein
MRKSHTISSNHAQELSAGVPLESLPTLSSAGIRGSLWTTEGVPVLAVNDDTARLWPVIAGAGISLIVNPVTHQLFRLG